MRVKTKIVPYLVRTPFVDFIQYKEETVIEESVFKKIGKVLINWTTIIFLLCICYHIVSSILVSNKLLLFTNGFFVAVDFCFIILNFINEFKK
jgi:hypothetical protein